MFNLLNIFKQTAEKKKSFRPYYERENNFRRILLIHAIGAFIIAPIFTYAMYRSDAPQVYITIGVAYSVLFPIYAVICGAISYLNDKLIYFIFFQLFLSTFLAYSSIEQNGFSGEEFFFFFAFYAICSGILQRLYPAILYHVMVQIMLLYGHEHIENTGLSPFVVTGAFFILGFISTFAMYARREMVNNIESYSDYLKRIMNNPGSGYILFDLEKEPTIVDYNNEALRVLNIQEGGDHLLAKQFFGALNKLDFDQIEELKLGSRYIKNISFSRYNTRSFVELKIVILPLKNDLYWLANITDVTPEVLKREELELKEKRYRNLYFRNKAGVFTLNNDSVIIDGNDSFFKMFEGTLSKRRNVVWT